MKPKNRFSLHWKFLTFTLIFCSFSVLGFNALSQTVERTYRVSELEEKLQKDAVDFLANRFPGQPFSVSIVVNPLRRIVPDYNIKGEQLPHFAIEEESIRDEWDDPTISLYTLLDRVKSVELNIQIPSGLTELEQSEMREGLVKRLRLIPARDQITVVARNWPQPQQPWMVWAFGAGLLFLGLIGFFFILRSSAQKLAASINAIQTKGSSAPAGGFSAPSRPAQSASGNSDSGSSDMNVHDPIKTREILKKRIDDLRESQDFFRLSNLLLLDEFGKKDPAGLGALLTQFPIDDQKHLFSFSSGRHWMEALYRPGEVQPKCLRVAEKLNRAQTSGYEPLKEQLLVQLWRLEGQAVSFLKSISIEESLSLLSDMPKYLSIPVARAALPGSWAPLLQSDFKPAVISKKRLQELLEMSLRLKPLCDFAVLDVFQRDQELLQFSQVASLSEEREIYGSLPKDSMLWELRPPFFPVFEADPAIVAEIVKEYSPQEWAQILFNVPHDERKKVDQFIEGKFRYLFLETLKKLDQDPTQANQGFELRSEVGRRLHQMNEQIKAEKRFQSEPKPDSKPESEEEKNAA